MCEMKQEGQFSKNNNLLQYAIQLVCVLKWNKRDSFQKKKTNLLQYAIQLEGNETRGAVFKKQQFITYAIQLVSVLKWNKRDSFQKKKNLLQLLQYAIQLEGSYWNETRGTVFKKNKFITVCYSTCVHIEMKQDGQFSKKSN